MSDMKTLLENFTRFTEGRFTGGSIDIEPLSGEEQDASTEAYYELFEFLASSNLPGDKPSDKLQYALRWIAKFEQGGVAGEAGYPEAEEGEEEVEDQEVLDGEGDGEVDGMEELFRQLGLIE